MEVGERERNREKQRKKRERERVKKDSRGDNWRGRREVRDTEKRF
jgi:hypothetical protein